MITVWNIRQSRTRLSAMPYPGEEKAARSGKMICWQAYSVNHQLLAVGSNSERILF
jgi:hypothetical protein